MFMRKSSKCLKRCVLAQELPLLIVNGVVNVSRGRESVYIPRKQALHQTKLTLQDDTTVSMKRMLVHYKYGSKRTVESKQDWKHYSTKFAIVNAKGESPKSKELQEKN